MDPSRPVEPTPEDRWSGRAPLRLLIGPYHHPEHWSYMRGAYDDHEALTFGNAEGADIRCDPLVSIDEILAALSEVGEPLSLFALDIDSFRQVNDLFGHPTGDLVIEKVNYDTGLSADAFTRRELERGRRP